MTTPEFELAYKRLNPEQKKAVDTIDGPVMVVAGPGTGKTEVLTLRIANILLQTDTKPEQVLALTFTEAGAGNMRKRLASVIGAPAYRVRIQTFHSFCNDILQSYPEYFPRIVGASPITEVEATAIVEEIISLGSFSILRPWGEPLLYVGDAIRKMEELKREGVAPEDFKKILEKTEIDFGNRSDLYHEKGAYKGKMKSEHVEFARKLEKNKELLAIYESYQIKLQEKRLYDWSDMIMEVLKKLESEEGSELKLILQETHQYLLVDEHQDTNNAQNRILELLSDFHDNPNIFVVGDSKQAIFRFQGASVENFLYFKKLYPQAVLIDLFRNYRSTQTILDSAHSVIPSEVELKSATSESFQAGFADFSKKKNTVPKVLDTTENHGDKVQVANFKNGNTERFWIADKINEIKKDGEEIAIIYRSNREAFPLAHALGKAGVIYSIESDEDLLGDKFVKKFIIILEAVSHYGDDAYLPAFLHIEELGVDVLKAYKLIREAKNKRKTIYEIFEADEDFVDISTKLMVWVKNSIEEDLPKFLERIFRESGIMESALKSRDADAFLGIERIFEEAERIGARKTATLADFVSFLETLRKHDLFIKKPKRESKPGVVRLMTAHRSKGLEFDYVFITNASEKSFGGRSNRDKLPLITMSKGPFDSGSEGVLDDERRLFYVALTRAKKNIFITYHENDEAGKEILPTVFLPEIKDELRENVDIKKFEEKLEKDKSLLYSESKSTGKREIDQEFVSELFYKEQLSVTALNNYLECPWKYFYRNLLRIPYVKEKYLIYGTAMHSAVEIFFKTKQNPTSLKKLRGTEKEFLLETFENCLEDVFLLDQEKAEMLERGKNSLSAWYEERHSAWDKPYQLEQALYGIELDGVRLSGKLDKVEFVQEGGAEVIVTDYKTGKAKSRNDIEGKTKESNGNLKRQLIFYKLLLDLQGDYNMTKGIIEFLEPNDSGKIKYEEFEIEKQEVEELKETVKRVADEITTLKFWDTYCDDKDCEYCGYRRLLEK